MKSKLATFVFVTALVIPAWAFAQSASESMHQAGEAAEGSAKSAGHAITDVYHGTKTATIDTTITAKVKHALSEDATTKNQDIHVKTVERVVTLRGKVSSESIADQAVRIAEKTGDVKSVRNKLVVSSN